MDIWNEFQKDPASALVLAARPATRAASKLTNLENESPEKEWEGRKYDGNKEALSEDRKETTADKGRKEEEMEAEKATEEEKATETTKVPGFLDTDLTISQILAQASGNFMHWPKVS